ncbi:MAG: HIT family protein [Clostridiales bacterium]|nr:HIT family protein [Clostridiales bacterium]
MGDCFFCKMAKGEIPTNTVYEDGDVRVILDINPVNPGHCLVIPKTHAANIYEIKPDVLSKAMAVAQKTALKVKKATDCDGINILQNNEEAAGQTVFHFHIHVMPRYKGDKAFNYKTITMTDDEFKEIKNKIKMSGVYEI